MATEWTTASGSSMKILPSPILKFTIAGARAFQLRWRRLRAGTEPSASSADVVSLFVYHEDGEPSSRNSKGLCNTHTVNITSFGK